MTAAVFGSDVDLDFARFAETVGVSDVGLGEDLELGVEDAGDFEADAFDLEARSEDVFLPAVTFAAEDLLVADFELDDCEPDDCEPDCRRIFRCTLVISSISSSFFSPCQPATP